MGLSVKNLVCTVPKERLEEEECRQSKQAVFLENQNYISTTEKYDRTCSQDKLFCIVSKESSDEYQTPRKDKKTDSNHPENSGYNFKSHKRIKCRQYCQNSCEKYGIFIINIIHPDPEPQKKQEWERKNQTIIHISPKHPPEKVEKHCPRKRENAIWKMPQKNMNMGTEKCFFE